jgi:hypothetical protein
MNYVENLHYLLKTEKKIFPQLCAELSNHLKTIYIKTERLYIKQKYTKNNIKKTLFRKSGLERIQEMENWQ